MRDVYIEWLVAKKPSTGHKVLKTLCLVATIFVAALFFLYFNIFLLLGAILLGVLTYFVHLFIYKEYEYLYVNGELTIDRILQKSSRKRMAVYDLSKVEIIAPLNSHKLDGFQHKQYRQLDYTSGMRTSDSHIFVMYYDGGQKILLEPSKNLIEAMRSHIPHKVHMEI